MEYALLNACVRLVSNISSPPKYYSECVSQSVSDDIDEVWDKDGKVKRIRKRWWDKDDDDEVKMLTMMMVAVM